MPELPEVETVRRGIEKRIVGLTVESVSIFAPQILKSPITDPLVFSEKLAGMTFVDARRRGKHLIFGLTSGYALYAHLNMRGQFVVALNSDLPQGKYLCALFRFVGGVELRYHDIWRWGELRLLHDSQSEIFGLVPALASMGAEPLSEGFCGAVLQHDARSRYGSPIKTVLLDQSVVAGVGNIYADESLYRSGIAPIRKARTLTDRDWHRLASEIINVLKEAADCGGTLSDNYVDVDGSVGRYQPQVYGRAKENCTNCGTPLVTTRLGGRSTVYCPECQR
jgi:formamidopyrimidine-DNA glycosylase